MSRPATVKFRLAEPRNSARHHNRFHADSRVRRGFSRWSGASAIALALAEERLGSFANDSDEIRERARTSRNLMAGRRVAGAARSARFGSYTAASMHVIGADGSQIVPDRHDTAQCCLLNVGLAALRYGGSDRPTLLSRAASRRDEG